MIFYFKNNLNQNARTMNISWLVSVIGEKKGASLE